MAVHRAGVVVTPAWLCLRANLTDVLHIARSNSGDRKCAHQKVVKIPRIDRGVHDQIATVDIVECQRTLQSGQRMHGGERSISC